MDRWELALCYGVQDICFKPFASLPANCLYDCIRPNNWLILLGVMRWNHKVVSMSSMVCFSTRFDGWSCHCTAVQWGKKEAFDLLKEAKSSRQEDLLRCLNQISEVRKKHWICIDCIHRAFKHIATHSSFQVHNMHILDRCRGMIVSRLCMFSLFFCTNTYLCFVSTD